MSGLISGTTMWMMISIPATLAFAVHAYYQGPGWMAHSECPYCCWCISRKPFADRVENQIREWL